MGRAPATTTSDLLSAIDRERDLPPHVLTTARALQALVDDAFQGRERRITGCAARCWLAIPIAWQRRRAPGSPRVLLSSGHGAAIGPESGVRQEEFLLALDVTCGAPRGVAEARIRMASAIDAAWLQATRTAVEHHFDRDTGTVRAMSRDYYDALVLSEHAGRRRSARGRANPRRCLCRAPGARSRRAVTAPRSIRGCRHRPPSPGRARGIRDTRARRTSSPRALSPVMNAAAWTSSHRKRFACRAVGKRGSSIRLMDRCPPQSNCRSCSGWRTHRASARVVNRCCYCCSRPTAGPCRRRGICAASGNAHIPKCAGSCAVATRSIRGRRIRGPRSRRRGRQEGARSGAAAERGASPAEHLGTRAVFGLTRCSQQLPPANYYASRFDWTRRAVGAGTARARARRTGQRMRCSSAASQRSGASERHDWCR